MPSKAFIELSKRLDILTRLVAVGLVTGKRQIDQIRILSLAGMGPSDIASLLGTTPNTVNVALSALRKGSKMNLKHEGGREDA